VSIFLLNHYNKFLLDCNKDMQITRNWKPSIPFDRKVKVTLYFLACSFIGFNIVTATYFTSTERPRPAHILSFLRGLFVLVPVAFLLSTVLKMTGVWLAYPITECVVAMVGTVFYTLSRES